MLLGSIYLSELTVQDKIKKNFLKFFTECAQWIFEAIAINSYKLVRTRHTLLLWI